VTRQKGRQSTLGVGFLGYQHRRSDEHADRQPSQDRVSLGCDEWQRRISYGPLKVDRGPAPTDHDITLEQLAGHDQIG
jgi:hypothetical protein